MKRNLVLAALLAGAFAAAPAFAQTTVDWNGAGDGTTFSDGANWVGGVAPADDLTTNIASFTDFTTVLTASRSVAGVNMNGDLNFGSTGGAVLTLGSSGISIIAGTIHIDAPLAGTGGVTLSGSVVTLSGNNTYSGGTTITSGGSGAALTLTSPTALGTGSLTISNASISNDTVPALTLTNNNPIFQTGTVSVYAPNGLNLGTGDYSLGSAASRQIRVYSGTVTIGGVMSGTGTTLIKRDVGTLIMAGDNTYTYATRVDAGTLLVNGSLAAASVVNVRNSATLGGTGTINGATTVQSGGTLAPGASPGVLSFGSSLTLSTGSTSLFEINGAIRGTGYDAVNVAGLMTYGGTLSLVFGGAIADGSNLDLFSLNGGSAGASFDSIIGTGSYTGSFTNDSGIWTLSSGGQILTFTESTGNLVFANASPVPEPGTYAAIAGVCALGLAIYRRRRAA